MVIWCAYNFGEFLLAQLLFETCRNFGGHEGAYMKTYVYIYAQRRGGKGNNFHESDILPNLATWIPLILIHMLMAS